MRPVVGERVKGRRNADLCAADFCCFASQRLRLRKSPLGFPAVAGLEQGLAVCQPSLAAFQQTGSCLIQWKPPRFEGKLPRISFPGRDFASFSRRRQGFRVLRRYLKNRPLLFRFPFGDSQRRA